MIPSLPRGRFERYAVAGYVAAFFLFLFLPLAVVALFAFNDANYPAPPWRGATLDWFVGNALARTCRSLRGSSAPVVDLDERRGRRMGDGARGGCRNRECVSARASALSRQDDAVARDADATRDSRRHPRHLDPGVREPTGATCRRHVRSRARLSASRIAAGRGRAVLVHRRHRDAYDRGAPQTIRCCARGGGAQSGRHPRGGAPDGDAALPQAGADRRRRNRVSDVVRELQHDADAGRLRSSADDHDVRQNARRGEPGAQRGEPVPDGRLGAACAGADEATGGWSRRR